MIHDRQRVEEDLRGVVAGEVDCSELIAELYATDAGPFYRKPLGIVRPRTAADVVQVVRYAAEERIPLHPRGAATSSAAQALGPGIVLDLSRFMRRILDHNDRTATIEPGAPVGLINRRLAKSDLMLGFEPSINSVGTAGGAIAKNTAGRFAAALGAAADSLISCEVVLADGAIVELGTHRIEPDLRGPTPPRIQQIVRNTASLLNRFSGISTAGRGDRAEQTGYCLRGVLSTENINLGKILCGSEGTLGVITRMKVQLRPLPGATGVLPLFFDRIERAADAAAQISACSPSACDLLDRRHLTIIREADPRYEMAIPAWAEAMLIVECHGSDSEEITHRLRELGQQVASRCGAAIGDVCTDGADVEFYRHLAEAAPRLLHRVGGSKRPVSLADELLVEPGGLQRLMITAQSLLQRTGITASFYANASQGRLQMRPFLDLSLAEDRQKLASLSNAIADMVWQVGGSLGRNSACALLCTSRDSSDATDRPNLLREVKREFDPEALFNPGKVVLPSPLRVEELLRPRHSTDEDVTDKGPRSERTSSSPRTHDAQTHAIDASGSDGATGTPEPLHSLYGWTEGELFHAAAKCSGCGICRAEQGVRMCPINHIFPREEASPRAKANLARVFAQSTTGGIQPDDDAVKAVADLCVHCHMCRLECPAEVDVPRLMAEAKAQHVSTNGLRAADWLMAHIDGLARNARRSRHLANWALGNKTARWFLEKMTGIARNRRLPTLEPRTFLEEARRRRLNVAATGPEKVAFFVDTYVNHFDAELGRALVAVLEHNDVMVWVPPTQKQAAMPMISRGAIEPARNIARHNAALLAEAVRQGYTILATEPSATLALTREYASLLPEDPDVESVADHTVDACHYLWQLHQRQRLQLDFKRLDATLGYHVPCHLLALEIGTPAENLLRLVPGVRVERLEYGCSGMAGTYGLQHRNYRNSLRAGRGLMTAIRKTPLTAGTTDCSTCRIQMQHGTDRPTLHPVKVLALAYGLMPELKRHLYSGRKELTLQ